MRTRDLEPGQDFEAIKQTQQEGIEFWWARALGKILEYVEFRNFLPVIERAMTACTQSGQEVKDHFVESHEMVGIGSGATRQMPSFQLSRYACYLIVQNGDQFEDWLGMVQGFSKPAEFDGNRERP